MIFDKNSNLLTMTALALCWGCFFILGTIYYEGDQMFKIYELTVPELDHYRALCNFDEQELQYFNLRSRRKSNVEISLKMNVSISQVSNLSRRVNRKISKVSS